MLIRLYFAEPNMNEKQDPDPTLSLILAQLIQACLMFIY